MLKYIDAIIYWLIVLIPFSLAIASAPANIFMGLLIAAFLLKKLLKRQRVIPKTAIDFPLLLFFIITCLSIVHSVDIRDTLKGGILRLLGYILIFFIVAEEVQDTKHINKVIFSTALGIILASTDGIWQVWTGRDFIRGYGPVINLGLVRATASFKDSNVLGIYLSALAPLILGLTLYNPEKKGRVAMSLVSLVSLAGIAITYSRPTLLAVYLILFFLGLAKRDKALISILIIFTLFAPFLLPRVVKDWAKTVEYNPLRFMCNDDRIAIYRNSLNMVKDHPVIGLGANTYMKNYKNYKESPEYRNIVTIDYVYAHNNFLHMAAEIGISGLGIFIWLLYGLFSESVKIYKSLDAAYLKIVLLSLTACLIAFLLNGLTESSLYYSRVAVIFWYISGFLLSLKKFVRLES